MFGGIYLLSEQYLEYKIEILEFLPNLLLLVLIGVTGYLILTYLIDSKTRKFFKAIIREITNKSWISFVLKYFNQRILNIKKFFSGSGNILTKLIELIFLLDYSTIYRAVLLEVDPSLIDSIDFIKKKTVRILIY